MPRARKDPAERPAVALGLPVKLVDILLNTLGVDEDALTADSKLVDDLGADSLDIVELQMACEEEFRMDPLDDEIADRWAAGTVGDVLRTLKAKGAKV